ncbi:MAG: hypothetical protein KF812_01325 [Fimbriimonadaceae bacterium]|nr:hypothetical protein [Fimbriimonadaceae bacterium]
MKRLKWLFYGAVGALLIIGLLLSVGQSQNSSYPVTDDYGPEGLAVFTELLKSSGREVVAARDAKVKAKPGDVLFVPRRQDQAEPRKGSDSSKNPDARYLQSVRGFVESGGMVVFVTFDSERTPYEGEATLESSWGESYEVTPFQEAYDTDEVLLRPYDRSIPVLGSENSDISARLVQIKQGRALYVRDGSFLTNRNIDKAQNAALAMDIVSVSAPSGRLVFAENLIVGAEEKGLLATLGNWAVAARWQVLLLVAVMITATSVIFGPPRGESSRIRSSRDLVDAVADVLKRGRKYYEIAFREREDARKRILRVTGSDPRTEWSSLAKTVPPELRDVMNTLHGNIANESQLLALTHRLHQELEAFESDSRTERSA